MKDTSDSSEDSGHDNKRTDPLDKDAPQTRLLREAIRIGGGAIVSAVATGFAANYFRNGCTNSSYMQNLPIIFIVSFVLWLGMFALLKNSSSAVNPAQIALGILLVALVMFPCIPVLGFWIAPVCN